MRQIRIGILLVYTILICTQCTTTQPYDRAITVLYDQTDSIVHVTGNEVIRYCNTEQDLWTSIKFRMTTLTDVAFNKIYECRLVPDHALTGNRLVRMHKVDKFTTTVDSFFTKIEQDTIGKKHSFIYPIIVREINHLMLIPHVKQQELIINSDLHEHGDTTVQEELSVYCVPYRDSLFHHPEAFRAALEKLSYEELPVDLTGLTVTFLFQPKIPRESRVYRALVRIYTNILEERGCNVIISSNLSTRKS